MLKVVIFFLLLTSLSVSAQTHYYVDQNTGNDSNDGLSLTTAWATIQQACDEATPNSIVEIKAGSYYENLDMNVSGTSGNPITFTNYQDDIVIIDGTGTNSTKLLRITDRSWLHFENLEFQNLIRNNAEGIIVETTVNGYSRNLSFKNLTIHDIKWTDVPDVVPSSGKNARGFAVVGRGYGIEYLTVDGCKIYNNVTGKSEALSLNGNVEDFVIENCSVYDNTNIGIVLAGNYGISNDPAVDKARNGIVRNNTCYNNISLLASSAGIYVDGGENIVIERNKSFQNGTGIGVGCEKNGATTYITVKNNLIYNNHGRGLAVGGYTLLTSGQVLYSTFRNNTLYQNDTDLVGASEINISKASNCVFEDNIIYTNAENVVMSVESKLPQANNLFNFNCIYTPSGNPDDINIYWRELSFDTLEDFQLEIGQDLNSIFADPQWMNSSPDFGLATVSPCLNTGNPMLIVSPGELDFAGNPRLSGQAVDIGAFEMNFSLGLSNFNVDAVKLYPNPLSGNILNLNIELQDAAFSLYDLNGRRIINKQNLYGQQIDLDSNVIFPGIYFYTIVQHGKSVTSGKLAVK